VRLLRERALALVCGLFALWAIAPIVVLIIRAHREGGTFGGAYAPLVPADQYRYLAWIRDAGDHFLISNQFGFASSDHLYLHPMMALSGLLWRLGLSLQVAYLAWTPIAIGALVGGFAAYVSRMLPGHGWSRPAALVLALLFFTPLLPLVDWGGLVDGLAANQMVIVAGQGAPYWQTWGYLPTALALGLMPLYFLGLERALVERRGAGWTVAAGLAVSWLHPWAGLTLFVVTAALTGWDRFARRDLALVVPALAVVSPLVYYWLLEGADPAWGLAQLQATLDPERPLWTLAAAFAPLAVLAAAGVRRPGSDIQERVSLLWPAAAVAVYLTLARDGRLPALAGVTLPLAVLAVRGWNRLRLPRIAAVAALAAATLPGMLYSAQTFRDTVRAHSVPYTIDDSERAALKYLARAPEQGGVLSTSYLGTTVPAMTGRHAWVGYSSLVPGSSPRAREADAFFDGTLPPTLARALVDRAGALYLLSDCRKRTGLEPIVGPLGFTRTSFGCASVYQSSRLRNTSSVSSAHNRWP
jgi:hypothetical protein